MQGRTTMDFYFFSLLLKKNILKLLVGRAVLCSCSFSLAISRGTDPLDKPFCCFSSLILRPFWSLSSTSLHCKWAYQKCLKNWKHWGGGSLCLKAMNTRKCTVWNYLLHNLASSLVLDQQRILPSTVTLPEQSTVGVAWCGCATRMDWWPYGTSLSYGLAL